MPADPRPFDHSLLADMAIPAINDVRGLYRVAYDTRFRPPGTIDWK